MDVVVAHYISAPEYNISDPADHFPNRYMYIALLHYMRGGKRTVTVVILDDI